MADCSIGSGWVLVLAPPLSLPPSLALDVPPAVPSSLTPLSPSSHFPPNRKRNLFALVGVDVDEEEGAAARCRRPIVAVAKRGPLSSPSSGQSVVIVMTRCDDEDE